MKDLLVSSVYDLCKNDLQIKHDKEVVKSNDLERLKAWLKKEILGLIENDFNRLVNVLYRIDIDEKSSKHAFKAIDNDTIASNLADLILERQMEKLAWRKKYSQ